MSFTVREEALHALRDHAAIPITFLIDRVLEVARIDGGLGGLRFTERAQAPPHSKDYDALAGEGPTRWLRQFDTSNWGLLAAYEAGERVGGAVIAFDTPGLDLLGHEPGGAVLWDLRVRPEMRGSGVGSALFEAAEQWTRARNCRWLKAETQNVNVGACHFYARRGCVLGAVNFDAYADLPDEVQFLWVRALR